ncbi:MAG TPA: hypothetical protein PLJ21_03960 [Pseudobdellovibrionaceae bacterium]|nr:hypothetical protein [Pseudobdellovibrionaceae bacterium]
MKRFIFGFLSVGLLVLNTACSNNGGGGGSPKGQLDAKALAPITQSLAIINDFSKDKQSPKSKTLKVHSQLNQAFVGNDNSIVGNDKSSMGQTLPSTKQEKLNKQNKLNQKYNRAKSSKACQETITETPKSGGMIESVIEIKGDQCPFDIFAKMIMPQENGQNKEKASVVADVLMIFQIKDAELQKELDVTSAELSGKVNIAMDPGQKGFKMDMGVNINGSGVSVSQGPFGFRLQAQADFFMDFEGMSGAQIQQMQSSKAFNTMASNDMPQMNMKINTSDSIEVEVTGKVAKARSQIQIDPSKNINSAQFFINDNPVSAEEYEEFVSKLSFIDMGPGKGGDDSEDAISNPTNPPETDLQALSCSLSFYSKSEITDEQLDESITTGHRIPVTPKQVANICATNSQRTSSKPLRLEGDLYHLDLLSRDYVSIRILHNVSGRSGEKAELFMTYGKNVTFVNAELKKWNILTSCHVVSQCAR